MDKKEEFKEFASKHPELVTYIKENKEMTWQKFYEIYDIYGDSPEPWKPYFASSTTSKDSISSLKDMVKNINTTSIQEHIKTAQKALSFIEELTKKGATNLSNLPKGPATPRPINKFFGD